MPRIRTWALVSAAVCALEAGIELVRLVVGGAVHGYTTLGGGIVSVVFIAMLGGAALGLALRQRWGWVAGVWAGVYSLGYGVVVEAGGTPAGFGYMVGGALVLAGLVKSLPLFSMAPQHA